MANRKITEFGNQATLLDTDIIPLVDDTEVVADDKNKSATFLNIKNTILAAVPSTAVQIKNVLLVDNTTTPSTGVRGDLSKPYDNLQDAMNASLDGDEIWLVYTNESGGGDYTGEYVWAVGANETRTLKGIGGMPKIVSTVGTALGVNGAFFKIENIALESTATGAGQCPFEALDTPGVGTRGECVNCNFYALGDTCVTADTFDFDNCYFESAGNNPCLLSIGILNVRNCYFKQPNITTIDAVTISGNNFVTFKDCWFDGGRIGIYSATGGEIFLDRCQFKGQDLASFWCERKSRIDSCFFQNTNAARCVHLGYLGGLQCQVSNSWFSNSAAAIAIDFNSSSSGSPELISRCNTYDAAALTNAGAPETSSTADTALTVVDFTSDNFSTKLTYFQSRI